MSKYIHQRVIPRSTSPTKPHKKLNREIGNRLDKGRMNLLRRTKTLDLPLIKIRNLLSPRPHHRAINSIRLNRKVTEGLQIISQTNSKVTEGHQTISRSLSKVIESPLLNNRQKGGLNVLESLQTMVSYLINHYPHPINEMKASREVTLNLRIKIKS